MDILQFFGGMALIIGGVTILTEAYELLRTHFAEEKASTQRHKGDFE